MFSEGNRGDIVQHTALRELFFGIGYIDGILGLEIFIIIGGLRKCLPLGGNVGCTMPQCHNATMLKNVSVRQVRLRPVPYQSGAQHFELMLVFRPPTTLRMEVTFIIRSTMHLCTYLRTFST